jgi:hypothetical protein
MATDGERARCAHCGDELSPGELRRAVLHRQGIDSTRPDCPRQDIAAIAARKPPEITDVEGTPAWAAIF